ncbi:MAG: hypothetical protein AB7S88_04530 [Candidatus Izemoplasmatales bacterium]
MRKWFVVVLLLLGFGLVGCVETTTTTMSTFTTTTLSNFSGAVSNVQIDSGILSWDELLGASGYVVRINGNDTFQYSTTYDLTELENGVYRINVGATLNETTVFLSQELYYLNNPSVLSTSTLTYDKASLDDLVLVDDLGDIPFLYATSENDPDVVIQHSATEVWIASDELLWLPYGVHSFQLIGEDGIRVFNVTFVDSREPGILSDSSQSVPQGQDATFLFNDYQSTFLSVSGNDITASDYHFENGVLTIDGDYISTKFENEPERTTLILSYAMQTPEKILIGYLFITLDTEE